MAAGKSNRYNRAGKRERETVVEPVNDPRGAIALRAEGLLQDLRGPPAKQPKFPPPRFAERKPGQRRMDHGARSRIAEWRAYQAAWQKPIDAIEYDAERFHNLRRNILSLNRKQTARLLRVGVNSVLNWEHGTHPVPFYAYLALLLISESLRYRMSGEQWKDWELVENFDYVPGKKPRPITRLVNRKTGEHFSTDDLEGYHSTMHKLGNLDSENAALRNQVDALTRENTEIRELFKLNALTDELHGMREHVEALLGRINRRSENV